MYVYSAAAIAAGILPNHWTQAVNFLIVFHWFDRSCRSSIAWTCSVPCAVATSD